MARRPASEQFDGLKEVRNAAFLLFGRYGYDGVSIDAIAKESGTSKSALYWHFKNKEALFKDCLEQLHRMFLETIFEPMERTEDPAEAVILFFQKTIQLLKDDRVQSGIAGYWMESGNMHPEELIELHVSFNQRIIGIFNAVFIKGKESGLFTITEPTEKLASTIIHTLEALFIPLRGQTSADKVEIAGVLAGVLFRAYLPSHDIAEQAVRLIYENFEDQSS